MSTTPAMPKLPALRQLCESYGANKARIQKMQRATCLMHDVVRGSSTSAPYDSHSIRIAGVDTARARYNREAIKRLQHSCDSVEAVIAMADPDMREILTLHYLDGLTWDKAAQVISKARGQDVTGGAIRKAAYRYLDGMDER